MIYFHPNAASRKRLDFSTKKIKQNGLFSSKFSVSQAARFLHKRQAQTYQSIALDAEEKDVGIPVVLDGVLDALQPGLALLAVRVVVGDEHEDLGLGHDTTLFIGLRELSLVPTTQSLRALAAIVHP